MISAVVNLRDVSPEDFIKDPAYLSQIPYPSDLAVTRASLSTVHSNNGEPSKQPAEPMEASARASPGDHVTSHDMSPDARPRTGSMISCFDEKSISSLEGNGRMDKDQLESLYPLKL